MTPFLDSLAQEGIRFTYNAVTTSICWIRYVLNEGSENANADPTDCLINFVVACSRATMFTGQYFARHQSEFLPTPAFCDRWNETWPYLLQQAGYYVGHSGKWQFYNDPFVISAFNWTSLHEGQHWYPWEGGGENGKPRYQHACDKSEEDLIRFLNERPKDRPFAITSAFYPPKAIGIGPEQWFPKNETKRLYENITIPEPYKWNESWWKLPSFFRPRNEARTRWKQRFGTYELYQNSMKCYYALITEVDKACEHIVDELKRQGIYEETMIIFTADNGFFLGEHGLAGKVRGSCMLRDEHKTPKH
jgi:arylsulfatase A-like enzyme